MGKRKTQPMDEEPPTLQARLMRLLSDADKDPQLKEGAERGLAIAEETYGKNFAAVIKMLGDIDARAARTQEAHDEDRKAIVDVRYQIAEGNRARANNAEQVAKGLDHLIALGDKQAALTREAVSRLGKLEAGQENLRISLGELAGEVSNQGERIDSVEGQMGAFDGRLGKVETEVQAMRGDIANLSSRLSAVEGIVSATQRFIEAFPPPDEIQDRMDKDT